MKVYQKSFGELSNKELHDILALRQEVFVVEQDCVYQDVDGLDPLAQHLWFEDESGGKIFAYARIFPPNIYYKEFSAIGRVVVDKMYRKRAFARKLMEISIKWLKQNHGKYSIKISAQTYLKDFYISLGFKDTGEHYLEDGIPHLAMVLD